MGVLNAIGTNIATHFYTLKKIIQHQAEESKSFQRK